MTLHHDLKILAQRTIVRASMPVEDLQHLRASRGAIQGDAHIAAKALSGALPWLFRDWVLPGTAVIANNVGGEFRFPQKMQLKRIDVICKSAPTGGQLTIRLTNNGTEIPGSRVTVQPGSLAATSGLGQPMNGGDVARVDVIGVGTGGGADLTVTVSYLPVLE